MSSRTRRRLRQAALRLARRRSGVSATAFIALRGLPLGDLGELVVDPLVEILEPGLEVRDLPRLVLREELLCRLLVCRARRRDRVRGAVLVREDLQEGLELRARLQLLRLQRLLRRRDVAQPVRERGERVLV